MARRRDPDCLGRILDAATEAFLAASYSRVGMADVARLAKVAPGTLYLYFENKDALFSLVLRRAFLGDEFVPPEALPVASQTQEAILSFVRERYRERAVLRTPRAAGLGPPSGGIGREVELVIRELYGTVERHGVAIRVIERSAPDWPELFDLHFRTMRRRLLTQLTGYLERRIREGHLHAVPHAPTAARVVLENVAWFAVHRRFAPDSQTIQDDQARETVVSMLVHALAKETTS